MQSIPRRQFLGGALATALTWKQARAASASQPKFDVHVHLGRDPDDMRKMSKDKLSAAVSYLTAEMDKRQVQKALIVAVEPLFPTDLYFEAAKLAPERLLVACSIMPRPLNEAVDKLKAYREQGAKALKLQPMQYDPHDPAVERLVYEAVKLRMPVMFHHTDTPKSFPEMLNHFGSTFTDGNFVVVHFGGVYGFLDVLPLTRLPNVYLETSTAFPRIVKSPQRSMLQFLIDEKRLDRLIFGSELPRDYETVIGAIDSLLGDQAGEAVAKAIYKNNADKILRITVSSQHQAEEEKREREDKWSEVLGALTIQQGSRVADVGAGSGFHTVRLARAAGKTGRVYAVEINENSVKTLRKRVKEDELENVEVIQGADDDPKLPKGTLDAILIVITYHEMLQYPAMLRNMREALKPGGRLVIVDMIGKDEKRRKEPRSKLVYAHEIAPEMVEDELRQAGFQIVERRDPFLQKSGEQSVHYMVVARR